MWIEEGNFRDFNNKKIKKTTVMIYIIIEKMASTEIGPFHTSVFANWKSS